MGSEPEIRVGVVGADMKHALEYASVINPPARSREPMLVVEPLRPHLEDRVAQFRCRAAEEPMHRITLEEIQQDPAFRGVTVTCWWGADRQAAEDMASRLGVQRICERPEDMVGEIDAVIISTFSGAHHADLAIPFLEQGIPTFIDKPFAEDLDSAHVMVETARRTGAILFSSSPWKWSPAIRELAGSLDKIGSIRTGLVSAPGPGGSFFYTTHLVETLQYLFGLGIEHVSCLRDELHQVITLQYRDGRVGMLNAMLEIAWVRHAVVYGELGYLEADISNMHRDEGQIRTVVEFVRAIRSGRLPLALEYPLEATKVMVAAQLSAERGGERIYLREL